MTVGDSVTFTATVTSSAGGTPTGLVTFFDGITPLGSATLNRVVGNDQAIFSTSVLNVTPLTSAHSITAVYDGDANFGASAPSPALMETLQGRNITQSLSVNPSTSFVGQPITATITLTDAGTSAPPGTPDTFSSTGAPATGRTGFSITLFSDSQVLVAGGTDVNGTVLNSAEIYRVSGAGFIAANGSLNTARTGAAAVLLPNGKVLVAGGSSDGTANGALASAELFDPVTGTFTPTSHNMTAARFGTMAVLFINGQVLLAGGENSGGVLSSAEFYDPVADTFTPTGSLNVARTGGAAAVVLKFSEVVIAGGSSDGTDKGALDSVELFSLDSTGAGKFQLLSAHLSAPRWQAEIAAIPENSTGVVLIAGGQNSTGTLTSADRFFPGFNSVVRAGEMAVGRANGSAVALPDRRVLLVGGTGGSQIAELYDFSAARFEPTGNLLRSANGVLATLLNNGEVLTVGLTSDAPPASDAELYAPSFSPFGFFGVNTSEPFDGLTGTCSVIPISATAAACDISLIPVNVGSNPHVVTTNIFPSPASANVTVTPAGTATSIGSSANPSIFDQPLAFTATVASNFSGATLGPTGAVQFVVDGATFGSPVPLTPSVGASSTAVITASTLGVSGSPHTVIANYINADGNFINSSAALSPPQIIVPITSTSLSSSQNPSSFGQSVTFTATVLDTAVGSTAAPTGTVMFVIDGVPSGTPVPLIAVDNLSSTASLSTAALSVNGSPHTVTANYVNADGNFANSGGALNPGQTVNTTASSISITTSSLTPTIGDTVTFTATVSGTSGTGTPTGLVTFFYGTIPLGSGTLNGVNGNDQATFSTSVLNTIRVPGAQTITAVYQGDGNFTASSVSSAITETFHPRSTTTSLSVSPAAVVVGQPAIASVTVTDTGTSSAPGIPGDFSTTGAPATGRIGFTITPFSDTQVLVAGGTDANGNVLQSGEIYSVSAGGFIAANGNLNTARTGAMAVLLPNGKVLIAGGSSDGTAQGALNSAELFDPITQTFAATSQSMTAARLGNTITLLSDGRVLLAGGQNASGVLNSAEIYDPVADTFTATANMNAARTGASAALIRVSEVLIVGGSSDGTANGALDSVELFSVDSTGAGTFLPSLLRLSVPRWQAETVLLQGFGTALIAGGQNSSGTLNSADMLFGRNFEIGPITSHMTVGRANGSAVLMPNGRVLFAGGSSSQLVELYDPVANTFAPSTTLPATTGLLATQLQNGQVLAIGLSSGSTPVSIAELYTPSFNPVGEAFVTSSESGDGLSGACILLSSVGKSSFCIVNPTALNVGTNPHSLTAGFTTSSSASVDITVNPAATATSVTSSSQLSTFSQLVTFTATVTDSLFGSTAPPTGAVQFTVDGVAAGPAVPLIQATKSSSTATFASSTLNVSGSPHNVTVNFLNADGNFINSNSQLAGGQTVNASGTSTTVASSVAASTYGQPVNFSVAVTNNNPAATAAPTGAVQFVVDGQNFGAPVALIAAGSSSTASSGTISTLNVNGGLPHTIAVNYLNADKNFSNSNGTLAGGASVSPAPLTVTANSAAVIYNGTPFTAFSATLSGFVNGESEASLRNSGALSGIPGFTGPALGAVNAGNYTIFPTQGTLAASNYDFPAADLIDGTLIIVKATTLSVVAGAATPANDPANGATLSFLAVVTSTTGGTPTGVVQFTDDLNASLTQLVGLSVAACPPGTPATASCAKFSPAAGQLPAASQSITASYQGDANFNSTSVAGTASSFGLTVVAAINTNPGQSIPSVSVGFDNTTALAGQSISLSCTVQAASIPASSDFPKCSLSSTTLPASGSVTVNLSTVAPTTAGLHGAPTFFAAQNSGVRGRSSAILGVLMPAGVLGIFFVAGSRKRRRRESRFVTYAAFTLFVFLAVAIGCGGHAPTPPPVTGGTPAGTYLVTVAGSDANHNQVILATIPLNVQ